MRTTDHPLSDLLRRPKEVTDDLEDGDVILRRRGDEPALRLSRADRDEHRAGAISALARAVRHIAVRHPQALNDPLGDAFPWLELLPATDRGQFRDEFSRMVTASAAVHRYGQLTQLVREWRATADIYADPRLARRLRRSLDAAGEQVAPPVT